MSAHVVPKAKPRPGEDDEKTTLESQWQEEASTTVDPGEAEKRVEPRPPQATGLTHTGASGLDESTVEEQQALALSAITPLRIESTARLLITQGNDTGQSIEVRPGKTYTIGRALGNDVVLTDIAVSRKHFDLRYEDGAWMIVDCGSGNGTVVNGNIEDQPFMLANGDRIEIGNTVFRYEQDHGPERLPQPKPNGNGSPRGQAQDDHDEDDELSTVAGKPLRTEATLDSSDDARALGRPARPKTLPPPVPLRPTGSTPPPLGQPPAGPQPSSTLPMQQMANRPPMLGPGSPTMLGDQMGLPPGLAQTAQPGSATGGERGAAQPASYPYPQATEIPPHSVHAQMLLIQAQQRRGDGSTAHVPPTPYDGLLLASSQYRPPQLSKRAKSLLAGVGLAVFAAIATIAIVKSGSPPAKPAAGASTGSGKATRADATKAVAKHTPSIQPITDPAKPEPGKIEASKVETPRVETPKVEAPRVETPKVETPKVETPKVETPKVEAPRVETPKVEPKKIEAPKVETPKVEPKKIEAPKVETPKVEPKKIEAPKVEPKKVEPKKVVRVEKPREPREPKRVATATDTAGARAKADALYRQRKFKEASSLLAGAAANVDEDEAVDLRKTANLYSNLGKAYLNGTAPATNPIDSFKYLQQAATFDRNVGSAFESEIQSKLAQVAPKAAYKYLGKQEYAAARSAMIVAEKLGAEVSIVRQKLEAVASELYAEANKELASNPAQAREKLRLIKSIVDQKSPWFQKANKALGG